MDKKKFKDFKKSLQKATESDLLQNITGLAKKAGYQVSYMALLLYYAYRNKKTPKWAKKIVLGAIAYLLFPFDFIPDLAPFLGWTDDLEMLSLSLVVISCYINPDIKSKARTHLEKWFGKGEDESLLDEIDNKL